MHNEQISRWGRVVDSYRYKGSHGVQQTELSSYERSRLTAGDNDLKDTLQAIREDVYQATLERAAQDGAGERAAEARARAAAQTAVKDYYDEVQTHQGFHRSSTQAALSGRHNKPTLTNKARQWFAYSPDEQAARVQRKQDDYDRKHQVEFLPSQGGAEIPKTVHATRSLITPSRRELRYMRAVGALDDRAFEPGHAASAPATVRFPKVGFELLFASVPLPPQSVLR